MRISESLFPVALFSVGLGIASAFAFDGTRTPGNMAPAVEVDVVPRSAVTGPALGLQAAPTATGPSMGIVAPSTPPAMPRMLTATEAFKSAFEALRAGDKTKAVRLFQFAAEQGHAVAQWKLGRMYADGDGVPQNEYRAFQYFRSFADNYADENPEVPQARLVANAFVALGHYYLDGINHSPVKSDPDRAREMYSYAASYFRDPDAQYYLARLYLDGTGAARDPRQALRWLLLAANKGQCQAQGVLGRMLFNGESVGRQPSRGLMWLTLARDCVAAGGGPAGTGEKADWVVAFHDTASSQATAEERAQALALIDRWMRRREP